MAAHHAPQVPGGDPPQTRVAREYQQVGREGGIAVGHGRAVGGVQNVAPLLGGEALDHIAYHRLGVWAAKKRW
jgi:hypothetical protein